MTTKAEWFRYAEQRTHPRGASAKSRAAAEAAPSRPTGRAGKAVYALEESAAKPSRKSTRKSANRQKTDVQFRMKRQESEARPKTT
jgi:hypothetical protein